MILQVMVTWGTSSSTENQAARVLGLLFAYEIAKDGQDFS